jgi:glycosyltransferase involved in cell wall biosynthesis
VITTHNSGAGDLIADGVNGWIVPVRDADALADRIAWCLDHPVELAAAGEKALETAHARTRADAVAAHVNMVLQFAAASEPAAAGPG